MAGRSRLLKISLDTTPATISVLPLSLHTTSAIALAVDVLNEVYFWTDVSKVGPMIKNPAFTTACTTACTSNPLRGLVLGTLETIGGCVPLTIDHAPSNTISHNPRMRYLEVIGTAVAGTRTSL